MKNTDLPRLSTEPEIRRNRHSPRAGKLASFSADYGQNFSSPSDIVSPRSTPSSTLTRSLESPIPLNTQQKVSEFLTQSRSPSARTQEDMLQNVFIPLPSSDIASNTISRSTTASSDLTDTETLYSDTSKILAADDRPPLLIEANTMLEDKEMLEGLSNQYRLFASSVTVTETYGFSCKSQPNYSVFGSIRALYDLIEQSLSDNPKYEFSWEQVREVKDVLSEMIDIMGNIGPDTNTCVEMITNVINLIDNNESKFGSNTKVSHQFGKKSNDSLYELNMADVVRSYAIADEISNRVNKLHSYNITLIKCLDGVDISLPQISFDRDLRKDFNLNIDQILTDALARIEREIDLVSDREERMREQDDKLNKLVEIAINKNYADIRSRIQSIANEYEQIVTEAKKMEMERSDLRQEIKLHVALGKKQIDAKPSDKSIIENKNNKIISELIAKCKRINIEKIRICNKNKVNSQITEIYENTRDLSDNDFSEYLKDKLKIKVDRGVTGQFSIADSSVGIKFDINDFYQSLLASILDCDLVTSNTAIKQQIENVLDLRILVGDISLVTLDQLKSSTAKATKHGTFRSIAGDSVDDGCKFPPLFR